MLGLNYYCQQSNESLSVVRQESELDTSGLEVDSSAAIEQDIYSYAVMPRPWKHLLQIR